MCSSSHECTVTICCSVRVYPLVAIIQYGRTSGLCDTVVSDNCDPFLIHLLESWPALQQSPSVAQNVRCRIFIVRFLLYTSSDVVA